jgi:phage head maturation protease
MSPIPPPLRRFWRNPSKFKMRINRKTVPFLDSLENRQFENPSVSEEFFFLTLLLLREHATALDTREALARPRSFDPEALTIEAVIASTTPVQRTDSKGQFWEVLDPAGLDLDVTRGSSILDSHRSGGVGSIIGKIDDVWIEGSEVIARIRFSERPEVQPIIADVRSGVVSFLSVGYSVDKWKDGKNAQGERMRTATKWAAREASFVAVPADPAARTRSVDDLGDAHPRSDRATTNRAIRQLARHAGVPLSIADDLIDRGATIEEANMRIMQDIITRGSVSIRASAHNDNSLDIPENFQRAATEGFYVRMEPSYRPAPEGRQFVGWTQADLAKECLRRAGQSITGLMPHALITRAMQSTSDYPAILANIMDKSMRLAYMAQPQGIRKVAKESSAVDFRAKSRVQFDHSGFTLDPVSETGEFHYGAFTDTAESYAVSSFGKIFALSRKALVNDDLGVFADITRRTGMAAAEFERQFLVNMLITSSGVGPTMSDGVALFDSTHGNVAATPAVIGSPSLTAARLLMRSQTGPGGGLISVVPRYLVVPSTLETLAEQTITSIQATQTSNVNVFAYLDLIVEPRLTDAKRWYVVADPALIDGLEYSYLSGQPGPQTESRAGFYVDGIEIKTRLDFGAGFIEWRSWSTNAGA